MAWAALVAVTLGSTGSTHRAAHMRSGVPMPIHAPASSDATPDRPATQHPAEPATPGPEDSTPDRTAPCPCVASCHAGTSASITANPAGSVATAVATAYSEVSTPPAEPRTGPVRFFLPLATAPPPRTEANRTI